MLVLLHTNIQYGSASTSHKKIVNAGLLTVFSALAVAQEIAPNAIWIIYTLDVYKLIMMLIGVS